jgi:1-acyl-sn-glycerol-3-phosphate acyltransferase
MLFNDYIARLNDEGKIDVQNLVETLEEINNNKLYFYERYKRGGDYLSSDVNDLLLNLTNLRGLFVGINKHGKNEVSLRQQIHDVFDSKEAVCIFPAGLVSRKIKGQVRDLEWKKTFVTYAIRMDQPIIPVFIDGELSNFFYRLSNFRKCIGIKANIEMLYLSNELFKQKNKKMTFTIGSPILPSELDKKRSERDVAQDIKAKVYELAKK